MNLPRDFVLMATSALIPKRILMLECDLKMISENAGAKD